MNKDTKKTNQKKTVRQIFRTGEAYKKFTKDTKTAMDAPLHNLSNIRGLTAFVMIVGVQIWPEYSAGTLTPWNGFAFVVIGICVAAIMSFSASMEAATAKAIPVFRKSYSPGYPVAVIYLIIVNGEFIWLAVQAAEMSGFWFVLLPLTILGLSPVFAGLFEGFALAEELSEAEETEITKETDRTSEPTELAELPTEPIILRQINHSRFSLAEIELPEFLERYGELEPEFKAIRSGETPANWAHLNRLCGNYFSKPEDGIKRIYDKYDELLSKEVQTVFVGEKGNVEAINFENRDGSALKAKNGTPTPTLNGRMPEKVRT